MLFWMWVVLFALGLIIGIIDGWEEIGAGISAFGVFWLLVAGFILIACHVGVDGRTAKMQARYNSLVYQYENDIYDNDNDLGKRDLMEDIQRWNEDLAANQKNQFEFIELK